MNESGLMLLAIVGLLLLGGAIVRLLLALRLIKRRAWLLPIMLLLSGILWLFLKIGNFPDLPRLRALAGFMFAFLIFVSVLLLFSRWLLPARALRTRGDLPPLLRGMAIAILAVIGLFSLLSWSFPGISFTPMFVTSGVLSIVLGLALQDSLGNLMSGIAMSLEQPFKAGDWIQIGQIEGEVIETSWRATLVRTRQNNQVLIPNNVAVRECVTNYDQPSPEHLLKIHVGVAYDTPCGLVTNALLEAASKVEELLPSKPATVYLKDFQDSTILYELRGWIDNFASLHAIESEVRKQIWYAFKRHGVTMAFPQRDVHHYTVPKAPQEPFYRLVVTGGALSGAIFPLTAGQSISIGRVPDSTISISDQRVSNRHAVIEPCDGGHCLRDLGSRHGTRVNGHWVESAQLVSGDEIEISPIVMVYEANWAPPSVRDANRMTLAAPGHHPSAGATSSGATVGATTVAAVPAETQSGDVDAS